MKDEYIKIKYYLSDDKKKYEEVNVSREISEFLEEEKKTRYKD